MQSQLPIYFAVENLTKFYLNNKEIFLYLQAYKFYL